jgi:uncharacterized membrane protein
MGRWLRERLTWKLLGLLVVVAIAALWLSNRNIQIGEQTLNLEALGVFLAALAALIWYAVPSLSQWADKPIFGAASTQPMPTLADRNRADLLEAVDQIWLKGLLDNLLTQDKDFQIKLEYLEPEKMAHKHGGQPYPLKDNRAVQQTFEDFGRRLVLLGEPGAGKTVLLLQLARGLHQLALLDATAGIPVIFPLSSWAQKQLPFDEWLRGELRDRYGASKKLAETLVAGERLIYLLDGLDEVNAEGREACLQAIKAFVEDPNRRIEYVLCSRKAEFEALETRLDVPGEIVLQPLSWNAIQQYVQGEEFAALRTLLNENAILGDDFARVPFMLNTMAYVTQGDGLEKAQLALVGKTDADSLRTYFLDIYITKQLRKTTSERYIDNATSRRWLSWLASQLIKHNQTEFFLESMQATYLDSQNTQSRWELYVFAESILFALPFVFLTLWSIFKEPLPLNVLFVIFIITVISYGGVESPRKITVKDRFIWLANMKETLSLLLKVLSSLVIFSILIPVAVSEPVLAVLKAITNWYSDAEAQLGLLFCPFNILYGIIFIFIFVLLMEASVKLITPFFSLINQMQLKSNLKFRMKPNQGIRRSLISGAIVIVISYLVIAILSWILITTNNVGFFLTLFCLIIFCFPALIFKSLHFGLYTFIQHYTLRHMLANAGHLPRWRYDKFLDYAAEDLLILRKVGGGYRFTHDYLRQHLARQA